MCVFFDGGKRRVSFESMDDQTRMMTGLTGLGGLAQADVGDPDSVRKQQSLGQPQQDIGDILQQIMAITDESLDEAQAR